MKKYRDFQRKRVYDAEEPLIHAARTTGEHGGEFDSIHDIDKFVDMFFMSRWYQSWVNKHGPNFSAIRIRVGDGRGSRRPAVVYYDGGLAVLRFPRGTRTMLNVLHEIAHVIVTTHSAHHGRRFCAAYLELVRRWIGKETHAQLKQSFQDHKVKFRRRSK